MSQKLKPDDPAYWMLEQGRNDPSKRSKKLIHRDGCYICEDEEFSLMGLPLCKPCLKCKDGHVAADDSICDRCGHDHSLPDDCEHSFGIDGMCSRCGFIAEVRS